MSDPDWNEKASQIIRNISGVERSSQAHNVVSAELNLAYALGYQRGMERAKEIVSPRMAPK